MTSTAVLAIPATPIRRPLHILTLTPFYPSQQNPVGGCFIAEPLPHLKASGVSNTVFVTEPSYRPGKNTHSDYPAQWIRFFSFPTGIGLASAGVFLARQLLNKVQALHSDFPIDLIHAHSALPCGHAASLIRKTFGIPFVVTVHGLDASSRRQVGGASGWMCERTSREVYCAASRVLCVSKKVREQVTRLQPQANTTVIYNGVDCELFSPEQSLPKNPVILAIGNLIETKGHATLLRAFAQIHEEFPKACCQIVGQGPAERQLRALAVEMGVSDSIQWLGRLDRSEVASALRACTVFALPSTYEGLGCVYLEAMASGKPVIGCRGQGIDEIIQDGVNGWTIEPGDDRGLVRCLSRVLRDTGLQQSAGMAARQRILNGFTLRDQARRLSQVYEECLA
jgi:teichuronic acid biosynthesis glycosyltransferase TuaC